MTNLRILRKLNRGSLAFKKLFRSFGVRPPYSVMILATNLEFLLTTQSVFRLYWENLIIIEIEGKVRTGKS